MAKLTPMMEQYMSIKAEVPDALLFFRLGDFYELFFDDALLASRELEITLTGRDAGTEERAPMCGVPYHAAEQYITRLIQKGYKVAICEQVEDPAAAKGVVRREIVRIVTPGTVMEGKTVGEADNNFMTAIAVHEQEYALAAVDLTTGELYYTSGQAGLGQALEEASVYRPAELIVPQAIAEAVAAGIQSWARRAVVSPWDERDETLLEAHFAGKPALAELTATGRECVASLLAYLHATQKRSLKHITDIRRYESHQYMTLDPFTRRNLELTETVRDRSRRGSLLWLLDKTVTAMGSRMLHRWIDKPLMSKARIEERLEAVDKLCRQLIVRDELRGLLKRVYDLERLSGRVAYGNANARDLAALKVSLQQVPAVITVCAESGSETLRRMVDGLDACEDIAEWIERAIVEDPPVSVRDGGMIKPGFHEHLDRLREASTGGKQWIAELEAKEREATGIKSLKIGFNKVFGYYIEVTKANLGALPEGRYERKQTLANAERFITPELKEKEALVLEAEDKMVDLEYELFSGLRERIAAEVPRIQKLAETLAAIDALQSLGTAAAEGRYVKPHVTEGFDLRVEGARHPVVEAIQKEHAFIANDAHLSRDERVLLITGPNMAGKSTYMRQTALLCIMAQIGSFVPAESAQLPIVDRIFTRIGAADDLIGGQSTFMMEMQDIRIMTERATERSLVIIDELGRGTSTGEGMAIAQAVIEYLHDQVGCKTLVSTHFHELAHLEGSLARLRNYCMAVKESGEEVTFLRKLIRGAADTSYGIYCARIAGLPKSIIDRAYVLLSRLENQAAAQTAAASEAADPAGGSTEVGDTVGGPTEVAVRKASVPDAPETPVQLSIFGEAEVRPARKKSEAKSDWLAEQIRAADLMSMTPLAAMNFLYDLKQKLLKS
jgi:DNA mismatch repair protein MutS